jgi:hypothetical protein
MNATTTSSPTSTKQSKSSKRAPYGFKLDFPDTEFTLRDLRKQKSHKVRYITLYMRVKKGLAEGNILVAGEKTPTSTRRGRKEIIYRRADAMQTAITVDSSIVSVTA